ncbi:MAG TPA: DUF1579 domain-containing protein [Caulobacter sp.]|nr:DUF1579 domain-containing protein [Caulobacter sp.]
MAYDANHDDGRRDFHFLYGRWSVRHRRLKERGAGCREWDEFEGSSFCQGLMGGIVNIDENDMPDRGFQGVTFRCFDVARRQWAIYWVDNRSGELQPPVFGGFEAGTGRFYGDDLDGGRPVKVRFIWEAATPGVARWTQAFSYDGGESWEDNWIMEFRRADAPPV